MDLDLSQIKTEVGFNRGHSYLRELERIADRCAVGNASFKALA
jgi:hypothetical protein